MQQTTTQQTLLLHLEATLVARAKRYAHAQGVPIDQLVARYFAGLEAPDEALVVDQSAVVAPRVALLASLREVLGGGSEQQANVGPRP